eukprot:GHUV01036270.1.p1 GENE.GHUV01036270.1~~GHUV01036270.1.p1  ORF type:complete len:169 (-),score=21.25 GHUV01036270.1:599-1105(-)
MTSLRLLSSAGSTVTRPSARCSIRVSMASPSTSTVAHPHRSQQSTPQRLLLVRSADVSNPTGAQEGQMNKELMAGVTDRVSCRCQQCVWLGVLSPLTYSCSRSRSSVPKTPMLTMQICFMSAPWQSQSTHTTTRNTYSHKQRSKRQYFSCQQLHVLQPKCWLDFAANE